MPPSPEQLAPSPHRPPPQNASPLAVCLTPCADYGHIKAALDHNLRRLGLDRCFASSRVLLKPNLVAARKPYDPACTDPRFVRAAAELVLDYGGRPLIGDSPAFASAQRVMGRCHMTDLLADLAIEIVEFEPGPIRLLPNGQRIRIARQAAECDLALNMPKVKAHSQLLVTLAVKNLFGFVVGIRKPWLHMRLGDSGLPRLLAALPALLPPLVTLCDGVTAMHRTGPIGGEPLALGLTAGSADPVATDTALLAALAIPLEQSPVWRACRDLGLRGSRLADIDFPCHHPADLRLPRFVVPNELAPVRFSPAGLVRGVRKRLAARRPHCRGTR